ncbi:MAG: hypothetical protein US53_C0036G0006 [Candidatus Woesebacteria bacterium GW2011_GWA1_37_7]|uniref:Uncharacterized protein n=1 Tax=Candidatus Woesebacteria bacterium GW2011_GWA1_37_7 TaxID=1618545 RepID=A0A0G0JJA7_9BACT|nr:MAG: hypothetical protein US53_C0036G0006 [Candidatus Woesebacteria bacterium GW2011_GWA1_37_7]
MNLFRLLAILAVIALALLPSQALAINPPDLINTISVVDVYGGTSGILVPGDQLYIIYYIIDYITNPPENINAAYLARIVNGGTDYGQTKPIASWQSGYNHGIISLYLAPPATTNWGAASDVRLEGNPVLAWVGAPPLVTWTLISNSWTSGGSVYANKLNVANRIVTIAGMLETFWGINMIDSYPDGSQRLSDLNGVPYFTNAIPNLYSMAPQIFPSGISTPDVATKAFSKSLEADSEIAGTYIDNIFQGQPFGITPMFGKMLLLFFMVGLAGYSITRITGETKPGLYGAIPVLLIGVFMGFGLKLFIALLAMFIMLAVAYLLFLKYA